jgi:hypothetical protein
VSLYIRQNANGGINAREWHVGDPVPPITSRVVVFQADGDELEYLLHVLRLSGSAGVFKPAIERVRLVRDGEPSQRPALELVEPSVVERYRYILAGLTSWEYVETCDRYITEVAARNHREPISNPEGT